MKRLKQISAILLTIVMLVSVLPAGALAVEDGEAKIGETEYETLDQAIAAAADGAEIQLLKDCTTAGLNLSKDITINGNRHTITFNDKGIALWGKSLTFDNCTVVMNGIGSTPYTAEWNWMTICASANASLTLNNTIMTMDGDPQQTGVNLNKHAIYFCSNNKLNLNNSTLTIKNYTQDALEWDGGDGGYNVNIVNSTFISDHNRSGFTGTFYATIDNSNVQVINSLGNGSNGTYYTIKNYSNVLFDGNTNWGISAWRIDMTGYSTLTATNNGYSGIWTRVLNADGTCTIDVEENGRKANGFTQNAGIFFQGNGTYSSTLEQGASVIIKNNAGSGIYTNQSVCNLTINSAVITNNGTGTINVTNGKGATYGGGIYNIGTLILGEDVVLYNNHADTAGDDIYNTGSITFSSVGSEWALDGEPDCTDAIDGWYDDAEDSRWNAHAGKPVHAIEVDAGTITVAAALKAAHGIKPLEPGEPGHDWDVSKSKTAENLVKQQDKTYTSDVTLSLPAAEEQLTTDIVFVLDYSSCKEPVAKQVQQMLSDLTERIADTNASVKVGAAIYRGEVGILPLTELNEQNLETINTAIVTQPEKGGSNMSAGLLAAQKMLEADTSVDDQNKYVILISDGITYIWDDEATEEQENYGVNFANGDTPNTPMLAGPDAWGVKYGASYSPVESIWDEHFKNVESLLSATLAKKSLYVRGTDISGEPFIAYTEKDSCATTVDVALYKSYQAYMALSEKYNVYAVESSNAYDADSFPWGASFMNYLAGGKTVNFNEIENDIYYLLDAGSKVVDVIGYADDYNFDFVDDIDSIKLTVNGEEKDKTSVTENLGENETSRYVFGNSEYVLHYYANGQDGNSDECFVWDINVPVSKFAPVQLTYTVVLTNPQTDSGTYGTYDADGSKKYSGLYTNNSAVLYPIDSNGNEQMPELFAKPTVSYTVKNILPILDTQDHIAYIIGYPDGTVRPQGSITRAEVTTIFFRLLENSSRKEFWSQTNSYSDVKSTDWFNNAVSTMTNAGIVTGYSDGTFRPNAPITRAEFAAIVARFSEVVYNGGSGFTDVPANHWAANYIALAKQLGWVNGYPDGSFKPEQKITRAEAMTLINRVLERAVEEEHMLPDMVTWSDNTPDKWYYGAVQEATNSHDYTRTNIIVPEHKFFYEHWLRIEDVPDWESLEKTWSGAYIN